MKKKKTKDIHRTEEACSRNEEKWKIGAAGKGWDGVTEVRDSQKSRPHVEQNVYCVYLQPLHSFIQVTAGFCNSEKHCQC